jgi:hypothetical protein
LAALDARTPANETLLIIMEPVLNAVLTISQIKDSLSRSSSSEPSSPFGSWSLGIAIYFLAYNH